MTVAIKNTVQKESSSLPVVYVIEERCVGCQECVTRCPTRALSMDVARWLAVADNKLCVGCRQCVRTCPLSAIVVEGPRVVSERAHLMPAARPQGVGDIAEVRPGFLGLEDAVVEAERCLNCPDPTCVRGCPAHNDIPAFIEAIRNRDLERAQSVISKTSCMPDICSRVCDWASQCEGACSWKLAGGEPVAIGKLERFVTDNIPVPDIRRASGAGDGLSVGIVGAGPAGIAAAWELASARASVTIYDRDDAPGGVMHWGIPSYVLPDLVSERPVKALRQAGVEFRTGTQVTEEGMARLLLVHDVVIAAPGAPVQERPAVPGVDLDGVIDATTFLRRAKQALSNGMVLPDLQGTRVLVLGGSDTSIDVARSAVRLGAKPVIVHRREEHYSRARPDEIAEAKNEGVEFLFATNVARFEGESGVIKKAMLVRTRQNKPTSSREAVQGSEQTIEIGLAVLATGYALDPKLSATFGRLPVKQPVADILFPDRGWQASGIFANHNAVGTLAWQREYGLRSSGVRRGERLWLVGDALVGPSSVVGAMAQGRLAAKSILEEQRPS